MTRKKVDLSAEFVRERFSYTPEDGLLRFKRDVATGRKYARSRSRAGETAGTQTGAGYVTVGIRGATYTAHRLIWLIVYGKWPTHEVDHINGIRSDNRLVNLRDVTRSQNQRNRKKSRNNKSGYTGVYETTDGNWGAYIWFRGKQVKLGTFDTKDEACAAYQGAATICSQDEEDSASLATFSMPEAPAHA